MVDLLWISYLLPIRRSSLGLVSEQFEADLFVFAVA